AIYVSGILRGVTLSLVTAYADVSKVKEPDALGGPSPCIAMRHVRYESYLDHIYGIMDLMFQIRPPPVKQKE
ncbi:hypothetical protein HAX54_012544, partial [Datura stramonium]|nr:hypothetical protein [Datura stramonium]